MNFTHWYAKPEQSYLKASILNLVDTVPVLKQLNTIIQVGAVNLKFAHSTALAQKHIIKVSNSIYDDADIVSIKEMMPILSKSVDFIMVMHSFETSHNAHAFIREINRILKDDGYVLVVALNKPSIANIVGNIQNIFSPKLDIVKTIPASKMDDWFSVLGYTKINQNYLFTKKIMHTIFNEKLHKLNNYLFQFGDVYSCLYKKSVIPLTLDKSFWKAPIPLKPLVLETRNQHKKINHE